MPRTPKFPPYPSKNTHSSGQARIKIRGRAYYLGPYGSPESWAEYNRLLNEWRAGGLQKDEAQPVAPTGCRTVAQLIDAWWTWASKSQLDTSGNLRREAVNRRYAYSPLARLFGDALVSDFGRAGLMQLQIALASGSWLTEVERSDGRQGWCRNHVNRCTARVKALFSWGELHGCIPEGTAARLVVVKGLAEGEHGVRDTEEVPPVPEAVYTATLTRMPRVLRAVAELLALTGARPSEVLGLRACDLNRSGLVELARGYSVQLGAGVWAYQPRRHKTARKGMRRVILFGPRAQAVLAPFLNREPTAYLFAPADSNPRRANRPCYSYHALTVAVRRAASLFVGPIQGFGPCPHWFPYSLRHLAATRLAEEFGAEVASCILGHSHLKTTAVYALPALKRAADAIKNVG